MSGELRTQETQVFLLDSVTSGGGVEEIHNVSDVGEFGPQADDIDVTHLKSVAKEFLVGLPDNGEASLMINFNPQDEVHQLLNSLAGTSTRLQFMVCFEDGTGAPTDVGGTLTTPASRTTAKFLASVKSFRNAVKSNDAVRTTCALRISGGITWAYHA